MIRSNPSVRLGRSPFPEWRRAWGKKQQCDCETRSMVLTLPWRRQQAPWESAQPRQDDVQEIHHMSLMTVIPWERQGMRRPLLPSHLLRASHRDTRLCRGGTMVGTPSTRLVTLTRETRRSDNPEQEMPRGAFTAIPLEWQDMRRAWHNDDEATHAQGQQQPRVHTVAACSTERLQPPPLTPVHPPLPANFELSPPSAQ